VNIYIKFLKNFAITKLPISFYLFDNFKTGHVLYFAKLATTKLSAFRRALLVIPQHHLAPGSPRTSLSIPIKLFLLTFAVKLAYLLLIEKKINSLLAKKQSFTGSATGSKLFRNVTFLSNAFDVFSFDRTVFSECNET